MNLLVNQLKLALNELVQKKGLANARVDHKVNAKGELVIAIIVPPAREGEWRD